MTTEEFWRGNPDLFWLYRFCYIEKTKQEYKQANYVAWLQGSYIYEAVSVALSNAFSKRKLSYREEPYSEKEEKVSSVEAKLKARVLEVQRIVGERDGQ